jgi:hypothetical protein
MHTEKLRTRLKRSILRGKYGYLYLQDGELCLVALNKPETPETIWNALDSRKLFISQVKGQKGKRLVQDIRAEGIPETKWTQAANLVVLPPAAYR